MTNQTYKHTQIGWVIIFSLLILFLILIPVQAALGEWTWLSILFLIPFVFIGFFATLTVEIDPRQIRFWFGIGLVRKRIPIHEVRHYRTVQNPWYYGWGIHGYPGGMLYNVSGKHGVELLLQNGRRLRIGTDEPRELFRAIEHVRGKPDPLTQPEIVHSRKSARKGLAIVAGVVLAISGAVGGMMYLESRPPEVSITPNSFRVSSFLYSEEFVLAEITEIALKNCLPNILLRTNGSAGFSELRGHFKLEVLGHGQLFINIKTPPFVVIRKGAEYVIVNFEDASKTEELFARLGQSWSGQAVRQECP